MNDIQKIWDKHGVVTQGRECGETVEVHERLEQYYRDLAKLKNKYNVD